MRPAPELPREASLSTAAKGTRTAGHAAAPPNSTLVAKETPAVNTTTRQSMPADVRRGISAGVSAINAEAIQLPSTRPSAAAADATSHSR